MGDINISVLYSTFFYFLSSYLGLLQRFVVLRNRFVSLYSILYLFRSLISKTFATILLSLLVFNRTTSTAISCTIGESYNNNIRSLLGSHSNRYLTCTVLYYYSKFGLEVYTFFYESFYFKRKIMRLFLLERARSFVDFHI